MFTTIKTWQGSLEVTPCLLPGNVMTTSVVNYFSVSNKIKKKVLVSFF